MIDIGMAVTPHSRTTIAAPEVPFRRPIDIVSDHQIEAPVVVGIKPRRTRSPASRVLDPRLPGHIGERSIAIVAIENRSPVAADEQIGKAVVVIVAHGDSHPEQTFSAHARFRSDVGKRSIAVIAVQRPAQRMRGLIDLRRRAVHQIKIEQPVLVIVDPAAAAAHGLDQVLLRSRSIVVPEIDPCSPRHIRKRDLARARPRRLLERIDEERYPEKLQQISAGDFGWLPHWRLRTLEEDVEGNTILRRSFCKNSEKYRAVSNFGPKIEEFCPKIAKFPRRQGT